jgi:hypothetical protein
MPAQTAEIVSLSDYRQARASERARQESPSDFAVIPGAPFLYFTWMPVWIFPIVPQAPDAAQNGS